MCTTAREPSRSLPLSSRRHADRANKGRTVKAAARQGEYVDQDSGHGFRHGADALFALYTVAFGIKAQENYLRDE